MCFDFIENLYDEELKCLAKMWSISWYPRSLIETKESIYEA